jgi:hypothetical protein
MYGISMRSKSAKFVALSLFALFAGLLAHAGGGAAVSGTVSDKAGEAIAGATVELTAEGGTAQPAVSDAQGRFALQALKPGTYELIVSAAHFQHFQKSVVITAGGSVLSIQLEPEVVQTVTVTAEITGGDVESPDAAMKVLATEDLLDANPGRPGAPISIPGYPIETASSGIKAPQYMAPGVMGDHGEPIAMFLEVGSYLVPINLSANAHGNGYTDSNIYIADAIESVQLDGGAFNVREGNHALNLAATYGLRTHLDPFVTLTGDYRDATVTAGMSPSAHSWVAMEGSYGNGFLERLEHRKQFKLNGGASWHPGDHTITLAGIAYYGVGNVAGLRPMYGFNATDASHGWSFSDDTIDPRQKDQTHTVLAALNDVWKRGAHQELQFSGFFRTYSLALFSDFGLGLIRQSEWRTVGGSSAAYVNHIANNFTLLAGVDYEREAPRRDDLNHYNYLNSVEPYNYGPFTKIIGSDVTVAPVTPYIAIEGDLGGHLRYYLGWRQDEILMDQQDLIPSTPLIPQYSFREWVGVGNPKATVTYLPRSVRWAPTISASFGKSYYTEDPRNFVNSFSPATVVQRARTYQMVADKMIHRTELRLTLSHEAQNAELGKIDSDQGLLFPLGPGYVRYVAATLNQLLANGSLQVTYEQADARLTNTNYPNPPLPGNPYSLIPEAPRLIGDIVGTYRKLPFGLQTKSEFEYVGRKVVGTGCDQNQYDSYLNHGYPGQGTGPWTTGNGYPTEYNPNNPALMTYAGCYGVPNKEFRLALTRPFLEGRLNVGLNMMIASGFTGQTTENFGWGGPMNAPGYGPNPYANNLVTYANPLNEVVGVRIPDYASISLTYHFRGAER